MPSINLASKYSSKLDQLFAKGSYTDQAVNQKYDFDGVRTINVLNHVFDAVMQDAFASLLASHAADAVFQIHL